MYSLSTPPTHNTHTHIHTQAHKHRQLYKNPTKSETIRQAKCQQIKKPPHPKSNMRQKKKLRQRTLAIGQNGRLGKDVH